MRRLLSVSTLGLAGLVAVGLMSLQGGMASADDLAKRDEDIPDIVLTHAEDDDDLDDLEELDEATFDVMSIATVDTIEPIDTVDTIDPVDPIDPVDQNAGGNNDNTGGEDSVDEDSVDDAGN